MPTSFRLTLIAFLTAAATAQNVVATHTNYGVGCGMDCPRAFYESFAAGSFDLANSNAYTMVPTATGYVVVPGGASIVPHAAHAILPMGNDSEVIVTPSVPFPDPCSGSVTQFAVCSNGFVSIGSGNGTSPTPDVIAMLTAPQTAWWCWHDYDPTIAGSGKIKMEETASLLLLTWDGVWNAGGTSAADASTFQFQFDLLTGVVTLVCENMSAAGNGHLVGYSRGGTSLSACAVDLSTLTTVTLCCTPTPTAPLQLDMLDRPVIGTTPSFQTSNIPPCTTFLMLVYDLVPIPAGFLLTGIMPGCFAYNTWTFPVTFVFPPAIPTTVSTYALMSPVPNYLGLFFYAQSIAWVGPLQNAVTSNGVEMKFGDR